MRAKSLSPMASTYLLRLLALFMPERMRRTLPYLDFSVSIFLDKLFPFFYIQLIPKQVLISKESNLDIKEVDYG
jgi:hypothetical protein